MNNAIVIGHSHTLCLRGVHNNSEQPSLPVNFDFLLLRERKFHSQDTVDCSDEQRRMKTSFLAGINQQAIETRITQANVDTAILCINGNEHAGLGMIRNSNISQEIKLDKMCNTIVTKLIDWLDFLRPLLPERTFFYPSPPPIDALSLTGLFPENRIARYTGYEFEPVEFRLVTWLKYCECIKNLCARYNMEFVPLPASVFKANGFRAEDCYGDDPMHGNALYGNRVMAELIKIISEDSGKPLAQPIPVRTHPYKNLPDYAFWKQSITDIPWINVDPVTDPPFVISAEDKVATAGSCFAQHISKRLRENDFHFLITEQPKIIQGNNLEQKSYDFSARYGNIYTARQLLQLFERAFGYFQPLEQVWRHHGGGFCDPFRPNIEPDGFDTEEQVFQDIQDHLQAVRNMFLELDVFIFTLGLTECYLSRLDGAVYPLAPGVAGGQFDQQKHVFANFSVAEVTADLQLFLQKLQLVNPKARVIFTVSPVPLVATAAKRHVLVSTTYSKSVLRVAAEEIAIKHDHVCYFPSYEIITGNQSDNRYFNSDQRTVTEQGVDHVMRIFMARMTKQTAPLESEHSKTPTYTLEEISALSELDELAETICDEELLAR